MAINTSVSNSGNQKKDKTIKYISDALHNNIVYSLYIQYDKQCIYIIYFLIMLVQAI